VTLADLSAWFSSNERDASSLLLTDGPTNADKCEDKSFVLESVSLPASLVRKTSLTVPKMLSCQQLSATADYVVLRFTVVKGKD
jgi:hypothetical protein